MYTLFNWNSNPTVSGHLFTGFLNFFLISEKYFFPVEREGTREMGIQHRTTRWATSGVFVLPTMGQAQTIPGLPSPARPPSHYSSKESGSPQTS